MDRVVALPALRQVQTEKDCAMTEELSQRFNLLGTRIDILCLGVAASIDELQDNPIHHLKPCPCGRALTRSDRCSICLTENLRQTQLKP